MTLTRRRYALAVTAALGLSAGCLQDGQSTTPARTDDGTATDTATQSVTVTRTRTSGFSPTPWERTLTVSTATGRVTETLDCGERSTTDSAPLTDSELEPFRELAGDDAVGTLESTYRCTGSCPTDVPSTTITIATPAYDRTVTVDPTAEVPPLLDRVMSALETASSTVSTGSCAPSEPTVETERE